MNDRTKWLRHSACVLTVCALGMPSFGQQAVFIIEGTFLAGDTQDFTFDLSRNVTSTETLQFNTVTPLSGIPFDSVLEVFDSGNVSQGFNDDSTTIGGLNSFISWAAFGEAGTPLTDPLVAGNDYRLHLNEFGNNDPGSWETRIFAPDDAFTLTNASPSGTGTIDSISIDTNGGAGTAVFNNSTALTITDTLTLASVGNATLNHSLDTLTVNGVTTVNAGGTLNQTAGTINLNDDANFNGGTLTYAGGLFNMASGKTLTASNNATIEFTDSYILNNGATFDIQSGSSLSASNFFDIGGPITTGTLTVDGLGSSLTTSMGGLWGIDGGTANVTISNQATATLKDLELAVNQVANTNADFDVLTGATVTTDSIRLAADGSVSGAGMINVDGAGSSLTQNGTSTLTVGHAFDGTATVNVQNAGTLTTGTGDTTVNATGTLNLTGGLFQAMGDVLVDGGTVNANREHFTLAAGRSFTASNGGQANLDGQNFGGLAIFYAIENGQTYTIDSGADLITDGGLSLGNFSDGDLIIDGAGSSLTTNTFSALPDNDIAAGSSTAALTVRNEATATLGANYLNIALSVANASTNGTLSVESGADVTANHIQVATAALGTGTITVTGSGSTLTQNGASTLTVGHATNSSATVFIQNAGTLTTGTGIHNINATANVNISTGGTFNSNGQTFIRGSINQTAGTTNFNENVNFDGGTLTRVGGSFNIASGKTLTAENDSVIDFSGNHVINNNVTFDIQSGSDLSTSTFLDIGSGSTGMLIVDGSGSSLTTGTGSFWGDSGGTANVTIRNDATATLDAIELTQGTTANTNGTLDILSGATVTADTIFIAADGTAGGAGTITVDGAGSSFTQNGASTLIIGHATNGTATVNVQNAGTFTTGAGNTTVHATGALNVNTGGQLDATPGQPPVTVTGDNGRTLITAGTLAVADSSVRFEGAMGYNGTGSFGFGDGTNGGGGGVLQLTGGSINLSGTGTLSLKGGDGGTDTSGAFTTVAGHGGAGGTADLSGGTVTLSDSAILTLEGGVGGRQRNNSSVSRGGSGGQGGTINAQGSTVVLNPGTLISLKGGFGGDDRFGAQMGGHGGDGGSLNVSAGAVLVDGGTINLRGGQGNSSPLGSGDGGAGGTVTVSSGDLTMNSGTISLVGGLGGIQGTPPAVDGDHGQIDITGGAFNLNGGIVQTGTINHPGTGVFSFIGGTLHVETFNGTLIQNGGILAPGFSPGITTITGDYGLDTAGTLEIELGGIISGTEYDRVEVGNDANLFGTLDVSLINGFSPTYGDSFEFLTAGGILIDSFSSFTLPTPPVNAAWSLINDSGSLTLSLDSTLVGDLNNDGFVGIDDLNIVLGAWNQNVPPGNPLADPSGDGFVGIDDLNTVLGNWNAGTPPTVQANIPEPASLSLLIMGGLFGLKRPRMID